MLYRDQGKTDLAIGAFQSAVERNPDMSEAWVILGDLMDRTHNPLASQYFDNAVVWHRIMSCMACKSLLPAKHDKIDEALDIYKNPFLDGPISEAYLNAGILLMYKDSLDAALKEINILGNIDPANPAAWFYKADLPSARSKG